MVVINQNNIYEINNSLNTIEHNYEIENLSNIHELNYYNKTIESPNEIGNSSNTDELNYYNKIIDNPYIAERIYNIDRIGYINYPYLIYKDLNNEVEIRSEEILNEIKAQVYESDETIIDTWYDELLDANLKAEYLYECLKLIDPNDDENTWIEAKAWYEAIKKGLIVMENENFI